MAKLCQKYYEKGKHDMWYVIWTKTGNEEKCKYYIDNYIGSEVYKRCIIPTIKVSKNVKGKWVKIEQKLFFHIFS